MNAPSFLSLSLSLSLKFLELWIIQAKTLVPCPQSNCSFFLFSLGSSLHTRQRRGCDGTHYPRFARPRLDSGSIIRCSLIEVRARKRSYRRCKDRHENRTHPVLAGQLRRNSVFYREDSRVT